MRKTVSITQSQKPKNMWFSLLLLVIQTLISCLLVSSVHTGEKVHTYSALDSHGLKWERPKLVQDADKEKNSMQYTVKKYQQEKVDPNEVGGIHIEDEARKIAHTLRRLTNDELGVTTMQGIFDSLPYKEVHPDYQAQLNEMAVKVKEKLDNYLKKLLRTNKLSLEKFYSDHWKHPPYKTIDCCNIPDSELSYDQLYDTFINQSITCDRLSPLVVFNPGRNLTDVFRLNTHHMVGIKWQYFVGNDGVQNEYPAHNYPHVSPSRCQQKLAVRHRDVYVSTVHPNRKDVVVVIDQGSSMSPRQFKLTLSVAEYILNTLSRKDRIGMFALSSGIKHPKSSSLVSRRLEPFTYETKLILEQFLKEQKIENGVTNHTLGFERAFELIHSSTRNEPASKQPATSLILYISRGFFKSLTDAKDILKVIAEGNGKMANRVVVNTYAVVDEKVPVMLEKDFLRVLAEQNFTRYNLNKTHSEPITQGKMVQIARQEEIAHLVGSYYKTSEWVPSLTPTISLPFIDEITKDMLVSLAWPCQYNGKLLGIVGMDVMLGSIVEAIAYFNSTKNTYAFMIDSEGRTLMHPALGRPSRRHAQPMLVDIHHLENYQDFEHIRKQMVDYGRDFGEDSIDVPRPRDLKIPPTGKQIHSHQRIRYIWKKIHMDLMNGSQSDKPFTVALKIVEDNFKIRELQSSGASGNAKKLVYHRLDLLPTDHTCMHLKHLATLNTSALFLSASSFNNPFEHLEGQETKRLVQMRLAYLNDATHLIHNPGLKEGVKKHVAAISKISEQWMKIFKSSKLNDYIVRRYVATPSGIMQIFPGTLLHKSYDPTKRPWYTRALKYTGKVTVTAPYLDIGGAGYIVTISHTIYEGKHAALHGPFDPVAAVLGMDITLGYFYKLLIGSMPICGKHQMRCFIMDDQGYVAAHPTLVEPSNLAPIEQHHITHKEQLVVTDLLNHKLFIEKRLCNQYGDRTVQRNYQFNTSITGVLTNLKHGEPCPKYQLKTIPGTNTFLGVLNLTCDFETFCPCSTMDRLCFNCQRWAQSDCECPCECPLELNPRTGTMINTTDAINQSCKNVPEETILATVAPEVSKALPQCYRTHCTMRRTKRECMGVIDCTWCELDYDRKPLDKPFCSSQRICFAGVIGESTPYHDEIEAMAQSENIVKSTPVGPVAGGIMGCFLVLALGVYCYRHHVHRHSNNYITSSQDPSAHISQMDNEMEDLEHTDDSGTGHTNIVLATFDNPASMSPYRVNTSYRRPANTESDHGYSTMTPHEDSEQASTTCMEPLIVSRDRYRPASIAKPSITSILPPPPSNHSRRSRSPTPSHTHTIISPADCKLISGRNSALERTPLTSGQTVLPETTVIEENPHQVLAQVQVHMVDTH